jgi:hypothetical protein
LFARVVEHASVLLLSQLFSDHPAHKKKEDGLIIVAKDRHGGK